MEHAPNWAEYRQGLKDGQAVTGYVLIGYLDEVGEPVIKMMRPADIEFCHVAGLSLLYAYTLPRAGQMERKIVIKTCEGCPHKDHKGAFGEIAYVPVCNQTLRELPHRVEPSKWLKGRMAAIYTGEIPNWCPLEKNT